MRTLLLVAALLASPAAVSTARAAAAPGTERTQELIAALMKVKSEGAKPVKQQKALHDRAFAELDEFFDFGTITSKPIEPLGGKITPAEAAMFKSKFQDLIRQVAYSSAGSFLRKAKYNLQPETRKGDALAVPVKLRADDEDLDVNLEFRWEERRGSLRVVDVLFDGDSLIKDYQNQVGKIVAKSGVPGLFKALDERRAELEKGK
jgi:ABC-type transporter MlaC component